MSRPFPQVGVSISFDPDAARAARLAAMEAMEQAQLTEAAWACCFFTNTHLARAGAIRQGVLTETHCRVLCGTSAQGVQTLGAETETGPGVVVMVGGREISAAGGVLPSDGANLMGFFGTEPGSLLLLFPDLFRVNVEELLGTFAGGLGHTEIAGAGSGDGTPDSGLQLGLSGPRAGTVAALGLKGSFRAVVGVASGAQPVGEPRRVTQAEPGVLLTLDDQPALQVFMNTAEQLGMTNLDQALAELRVGFHLEEPPSPLATFQQENRCTPRPVTGLTAQQGLRVHLPPGAHATISFLRANPAWALEETRRMAQQMNEDLGGPPQLAFYFSSVGRGALLHGRRQADTTVLRNVWGDFPLAGLMGGLEISKGGVHNLTGVLAALRWLE
ncbi:MAG: FIST C-terminal domain-containing protein [Deltaproteobacteria bacterium]|nr:FIST C-terminal domain-containing protein [Deltaproteobacteria bacterium]